MSRPNPWTKAEPLFEGFIRNFGGSLVREHIDNRNPPKNADYFFRSPQIIAELKCIERDAVTADENQKLQRLFESWMRRRLIFVMGTRTISLREVPQICQWEWLALLNASRKRRLAEANEQIKKTKSLLAMPDAKGVLFLANEARTMFDPADEMNLAAIILNSKKPDGRNIYSHLHWIVYFSVNPIDVTPDRVGRNFWLPCFREHGDTEMSEFLARLRDNWFKYHHQEFRKMLPGSNADRWQ
jgi:hypothetical protein